jgi:hypothetical protein
MFHRHSGLFGLVLLHLLLTSAASSRIGLENDFMNQPGPDLTPEEELLYHRHMAIQFGLYDFKTEVDISVMVYYTPDFAIAVQDPKRTRGAEGPEGDVNSYIQELIDFANTAYDNSRIPQQIYAHCVELLDISEIHEHTAHQRLMAFAKEKGSLEAILNSADMAIVLTSTGILTYDAGGYAALGPYEITGGPPPFGWAAPSKNKIALVHELRHMMGAKHNRELENLDEEENFNYGMQGRNSPLFIQFFSLFSIFFLNCF